MLAKKKLPPAACSIQNTKQDIQSRYKEIELRPFFGASYLKNYLNFDEMVKHKEITQ